MSPYLSLFAKLINSNFVSFFFFLFLFTDSNNGCAQHVTTNKSSFHRTYRPQLPLSRNSLKMSMLECFYYDRMCHFILGTAILKVPQSMLYYIKLHKTTEKRSNGEDEHLQFGQNERERTPNES